MFIKNMLMSQAFKIYSKVWDIRLFYFIQSGVSVWHFKVLRNIHDAFRLRFFLHTNYPLNTTQTHTHTHTHMNERKRKKCSLGIEWSIIWGQIRNLHDRKHNVYFFYNFHKIIFCIIFFTHTYEVWEKKREWERERNFH